MKKYIRSSVTAPLKSDGENSTAVTSAPPQSACAAPAMCVASAEAIPPSEIDSLHAELHELSKQFCRNDRVAAKYLKDKEKIARFLQAISSIAALEMALQRAVPGGAVPGSEALETSQKVTFLRTVEQLAEQSRLSKFEVDKYLRWSTKGLAILECQVQNDRKVRERTITMDGRTAFDLDHLLNPAKRVGLWDKPVEVAVNNFKFKSLSAFALNFAIGCFFGCLFCYVPSASTLFLGWRLVRYGILDADAEWGTYCLIRRWTNNTFVNRCTGCLRYRSRNSRRMATGDYALHQHRSLSAGLSC